MDRRVFLSAAAVVAAGGVLFRVRPGRGGGPGPMAASAQEADAVIADMALGADDAPVTMIEYASLTCPHCANFHKTVLPMLKADYIDSGKVRLIHREVYFDRFGLWAAIVARCGGEAKYFGIVDILYEEQREWLDADTPAGVADNLRVIGKRAGIPDETLTACLNDAGRAETMVALFREQIERDGIRATPSFVIDGQKYQNVGYDEMRVILDERLEDG